MRIQPSGSLGCPFQITVCNIPHSFMFSGHFIDASTAFGSVLSHPISGKAFPGDTTMFDGVCASRCFGGGCIGGLGLEELVSSHPHDLQRFITPFLSFIHAFPGLRLYTDQWPSSQVHRCSSELMNVLFGKRSCVKFSGKRSCVKSSSYIVISRIVNQMEKNTHDQTISFEH